MIRVLTHYARAELARNGLEDFPDLDVEELAAPDTPRGRWQFARQAMRRGRYDVVLVEGAGWLAALGAWRAAYANRATRVICVMAYFPPLPASPAGRWLRRRAVDFMARQADLCMVISTDEARQYHEVYGIPAAKLVYLPYKMNSQEFLATLPVRDGDYVWAGGDSIRDYPTLFAAVAGLDLPVRVYTHLRFAAAEVPANVQIVANDNTPGAYYAPCAGAMMAVFPLLKGQLRSSGQASYLGAMFLNKPVILSDTPGARDIITDHVTGMLVPPGDPAALRARILELRAQPDLRRDLGRRAHDHVAGEFTLRRFCGRLFEAVARVAAG